VNTEPEHWQVDPTECPPAYRVQAPVAGANTNFVVAGQNRAFT
jgi:hypothetical protein